MYRYRMALVVVAFAALGACGGGGGGGSAAVKTATGGAITVVATELKFDVGTIDAAPGPLTVTLENHGASNHTFAIKGTKFELKANAGKSETGSVTLKAGTYVFDCTVAGHASAGMKGKVVVA